MRRTPQNELKKLVPLRRLAQASSYSFGYISILVQRKKLKAKKIGNKYYSTQEWFNEYLELHAQDAKKPKIEPAVEADLTGDLKNQVNSLVEKAIVEKLEAKATPPDEFVKWENLAETTLFGLPARTGLTAQAGQTTESLGAEPVAKEIQLNGQTVFSAAVAEGDLAEILNSQIKDSSADDAEEPETQLASVWKNNFRQGEKELKSAVRSARFAQAPARRARQVEFFADAPARSIVLKIKNFLSLTLKTAAVGLVIFLAAAGSAQIAPQILKLDLARTVKSNLARVFQFNSARDFQHSLARSLEARSIKAVAGVKIIAGQSASSRQFALNEAKHIADSILPAEYLDPLYRLKDRALALVGWKNPAVIDLSGQVAGETEIAAATPAPVAPPLTPAAPAAAPAAVQAKPTIAATPRSMEVLALITDKKGKIADGEYDVRFALYNKDRAVADAYPSNADQNNKVWEETQKVTIKNGSLRTWLGLTKNLPLLTLLATDQFYLGIRVAGDSEMTPRKRMPAPFYAYNAMNAAQLAGRSVGNKAGNIPALNTTGKNIGRLDYSLMPVEVTDFLAAFTGGAANPSGGAGSANSLININFGGTGLVSYSRGDMLYYDSGKTLSRLAIGQEGQVLSVVNGLPVWTNSKNQTVVLGGGGGGTTYTAGNGLTVNGSVISLNSSLSTVSQISNISLLSNDSADLTLETSTSGNIILSPAGYVSIGTTSPYAKLTVWGSGVGANQLVNFVNSASSSLFTVLENGKVGIGTSSPSDTLALNGAMYFAPIAAPAVTTDRLYNVGSNLYFGGVLVGGAAVGQWTLSGADVYRPTGNVGVGTTTPYAKLSVFGGSAADVTFALTGFYNQTAPLMLVATTTGSATSTAFIIDQNGKVGIGVSSPSYQLDVAGIINATSIYQNGAPISTSQWTTSGANIYYNTGNVGLGTTTPWALSSIAALSSNTNPLFTISTTTTANATSTAFMIDANGKVGIGTSSPSQELAVSGSLYLTGGLYNSTGAGTAGNVLMSTANGTQWVATTTFAANDFDYLNGNVSLDYVNGQKATALLNGFLSAADWNTFSNKWDLASSTIPVNKGGTNATAQTTNGVNYYDGTSITSGAGLTFDGANLGIGTTTPYSLLSVQATAGGQTPLFTIASSTSGAATSTYLTVLGNGNVGIGTAAPGAKLDITAGAVTGIKMTSNDSATSFRIERGGASTNYFAITRPDSSTFQIGTQNSALLFKRFHPGNSVQIAAYDGASVPLIIKGASSQVSDLLQWQDSLGNVLGEIGSNGKVGISTTSPWALLSINGTSTQSSLIPLFAVASSTGLATSTAFLIDSNGKVGIGTSSPSQELSVAGNGLISGNLTLSGNAYLTSLSSSGLGVDATGKVYAAATTTFAANDFDYLNGNVSLDYVNGQKATALLNGFLSAADWNTFSNKWDLASSTIPVNKGGTNATAQTTNGVNYYDGTSITSGAGLTFDGANLGIGTTTPWARLSIAALSTETGPIFTISTSTSNSTSTAFIIDSNGKVGIGTSSPMGSLAIGLGQLILPSGRASAPSIAFSSDMSVGIYRVSSGRLGIASGGTTVLDINSNRALFSAPIYNSSASDSYFTGNLGIGTTSPYAKLSITNTAVGTIPLAVYGFNSQTASLFLVASTTGTATSTAFVIDSNGKVGIGTSSPSQELSVAGNGLISGNLTLSGNAYLTQLTSSGLGVDASGKVYAAATTTFAANDFDYLNGDVSLDYVNGQKATALLNGFLASTDWDIFNSKISSTSLSAVWPLDYNSTTGKITSATSSATSAGVLSQADWNTFTEKMGSSTITSLTTNYLPKWTGTVFNNSLFYDDGTNIGIGTTSPWAKFAIAALSSNANPLLTISTTTAANATSTAFMIDANGKVGIGTSSPYTQLSVAGGIAGDYFQANATTATSTFAGGLQAGGSTGLYVLQNGNVGIGTAAPSVPLDVNGIIRGSTYLKSVYGSDDTAASFGLLSNSATALGAQLQLQSTGDIVWSSTSLYSGTKDLGISRNSAGRLEINNGTAGNLSSLIADTIGIGTTSPWAKLSVAGAYNNSAPIFTLSTSTTNATSTAFIIDQNGKVGIGTSSPSQELSVAGNGLISGNLTLSGNAYLTSLSSSGLGVDATGKVYAAATTTFSANDFDYTTGATNVSLDYLNGQKATALLNGFLAATDWDIFNSKISSTSLSAVWPLGYNSTTGKITSATSSATSAGVLSSADWTTFTEKMGSSTITSLTQNYLPKWTGTVFNNSLLYDDGTNLGIGTTTPWALSSIAALSSNSAPLFTISTTTTANATSTAFIIDSNGKVGIGTSSPSQELAIAGNLYLTGGLYNATGAGTAGYVLMSTANGTQWVATATLSTITGTLAIANGGTNATAQTTNGVNYFDGASITSGTGLTFDGTKLGIGTTTPWARLSIAALSTETGPIFTISTSTANSTSTAFMIDANGKVGIGTSSPVATLSMQGSLGVNASQLYLSGNGRVGIGTASPDYSFQVLNSGRILNVVIGGACGNTSLSGTTLDNCLNLQNLVSDSFSFTSKANTTASNVFFFNAKPDTTQNLFQIQKSSNPLITVDNTGSFGIGSTSPWAILSLSALNTNSSNLFTISTTTAANATSTAFLIDQNGKVGIGTSSPSQELSVAGNGLISGNLTLSGNAYLTSLSYSGLGVDATGKVYAAATTTFTANDFDYVNGNVALDYLNGQKATMALNGFLAATDWDIFNSKISSTSLSAVWPLGYSSVTGQITSATSSAASAGVLSSADWITFTEKMGSSTITSLTQNYLPKWTGTVFNNSILFDDGTNLGIGTTSPWAKFSIAALSSNSNPLFTISTTTSGNATSTAFMIDANGRVGIGTSSPSQELSVAGNALFGTGAGSLFTLNAGTFAWNQMATTTILDNTLGAWNIATSSAAGNVPIISIHTVANQKATTSINSGLDIDNGALTYDYSSGITTVNSLTSGGGMSLGSDAGAASWIDMAVTSNSAISSIQSYSAQINANPILTIYSLSDGSGGIIATSTAVGIGTTTPLAMLDIFAGSTTPFTTGFMANYDAVMITNQATSSTNSINKTGLNIISTGGWTGTGSKNIGLYVSSVTGGTENYDAIFNGGGNVGVGTTSPKWALQIASTSATLALTDLSMTAASNLQHWLFTSQGGNLYIGTSTGSYATTTIPAFMMNNTGFLGLGSTTPGTILSLGDTANYVNLSNTATSTFAYGLNAKSGCFAINGVCIRSGTATALDDLTDVTITSAAYGDLLMYDGSNWADTATNTLGLVTSVALSAPLGLTVSGSPITTNGTLALTYTTGYSIPTDLKQTSWDNKWDLASTTIAVPYGGTGWTNLYANAILLGNGATRIATTSIGAVGNVLMYTDGAPTWVATTTFATNDFDYTTGATNVSLDYVNGQKATALLNGFLAATDWDIFNSKISSTSLSAVWPLGYSSVTGQITSATSSATSAGVLSQADWTTFTEKMGSSTITSLTQNYLPKWTGTVFNNSILYDDGTNLGIGTTSPWAKFSIAALSSNSNPLFTISTTTSGNATSTVFMIDANGRVGIGTSSPSQELSVAGNGYFTGTLEVASLAGATSCLQAGPDGIIARSGSACSTGTGGSSLWATSTLDIFAIYPAGGTRVGIGTTSPFANLAIFGNNVATTTFALTGYYNQTAPLMLVATTTGSATSTAFIIDSNGKVGIGTSSPYTQLSVAGGVAGSYFNADSATATSTFAGGLNVLAINFPATSTPLVYANGGSFISNYGTGNLFIGPYAGNTSLTGGDNIGIGVQALSSLTSGLYNTAQGNEALTADTSGDFNTAQGFQALSSNTSGDYNTAQGYRTLNNNTTGLYNNAQGSQALYWNTTGSSNSAIGYQSLFYNSTGKVNTALGYNAGVGDGRTSGPTQDERSKFDSAMTFLGFMASRDYNLYASTTAMATSTAIGAGARVGGNNMMALGGIDINAVSVGIGTSTPWAHLSIVASTTASSFNWPMLVIATTTNTATNTAFIIDQNGKVGIGTSSPSQELSVAGNGYFTGTLAVASLAGATSCLQSGPDGIIARSGSACGVGSTGGSSLWATSTADIFAIYPAGGTRVGIGTTSPFANLAVFGNNVATTTFALTGYFNQTAPLMLVATTTGSATSTAFVIDQNGKVGIGTSTPSQELSVAGNALFGTGAGSLFTLNAGTFAWAQIATTTILDNTAGAWNIATSTAAGNQAIITIQTTAGNLATTTINGGLTVNNGDFNYDYSSGVTSINSLMTGPATFDTDMGAITWIDMPVTSASAAGSAQSYTASINSNPLLTIFALSDGADGIIATSTAVGIGTTTPLAMLDIFAGSTTPFTTGFMANYDAVMITNQATSSTASINKTGLNIISTGGWTGTGSKNIGLYVSSVTGGTENYDAIFNGGGNVGMGTTSPYAKLSVFGGSTAATTFAITGYYNQTAALMLVASSTGTATSTAFIIDSNGKVGIGTSTPYTQLSVAGGLAADYLNINSTATSTMNGGLNVLAINQTGTASSTFANGIILNGGCFYVNGACLTSGGGGTSVGGTGAIQFANGTAFNGDATNFFWDNTNKLLGVGTSSPYAKLSITAPSTGSAFHIEGLPGGSAELFSISTTTSGNATSTAFIIDNNGKVGIGTSSPAADFANAGKAYFGSNVGIMADTGAGYALNVRGIVNISSTLYAGGIYGSTYTNTTNGTVGAPAYTFNNDTDMGIYHPAADNLGFVTQGVERLRIADFGNIGIGTSSPFARLSVFGNNAATTTFALTGYYSQTAPLMLVATTTGSATSTAFIIDQNGKVGIGTSTPSQELSVAGNALFGTGAGSLFTLNAGTFAWNQAATTTILDNTVGAFSIATSTAAGNIPIMTITTSAGNPATTTWTGGFDIGNGSLVYDYGSALISASGLQISGGLNFGTDPGLVSWADIDLSSALASAPQGYSASIASNPILTVYALSDGSGNVIATSTAVGIGTTTPLAMLDIFAGSTTPFTTGFMANYDAVMITNQATSSTASINKTGLNIISTGGWSGTSAKNIGLYVSSVTGGTENYDAIFNGGGNVGMGTTSPYAKLSVFGGSTDTTTFALTGYYNQTAPLMLVATTTGSATSTAFIIDSNGKVGIGTSSPYIQLSVAGGMAADYLNINSTATSTMNGGLNVLAINQTGTASSTFANGIILNGGCFYVNGACITNGAGATAAGGTGAIQFANGTAFAGDATNFFWDNTNKLFGIGTSSPYAKLSITAPSTGSAFHIEGLPAGTAELFSVSTTTSGNATSTAFLIDQNGKVGIGTSSPSQELSVAGNGYFTGTLSVGSLTGADTQCLQTGPDGIITRSGSACGVGSSGGSSLWATSTTNSLAIYPAGGQQVGIGTTSPWAVFSIAASSTNSALIPLFAVSTSTASATSTAFMIDSNGKVGIGTSSPVATLSMQGSLGVNSSQLYLSGNDYVGIGTTTPTAVLAIAGNTAATAEQLLDVASSTSGSLFHIRSDGSIGFNTSDPMGVLDAQSFLGSATSTANFNGISSPWFGFGSYQNFLLQTEVLGTTWAASSTTVLTGTVITVGDPRGGAAGDATGYGSTATANVRQQVVNSAQGTWSFSVWLKAASSTVSLQTATSCSIAWDFGTGTATSTFTKVLTVGPTWQRYYVSGNATTTHTWKNVYIINGRNNIAVWGAQFEPTIFPSQYSNAQTSAATAATAAIIAHINSALNVSGAITSTGVVTGVGIAAGGAITGASTIANSGTQTQTLAPAAGTGTSTKALADGLVMTVSAATATLNAYWSPRLRFSSNVYDTGASASRRADWLVQNQTWTGNPGTSTLAFSYAYNGNATSTLLALTSAGNVGIGTTSPDYVLDVNGSAALGAGAEVMRIDSTGFVGIGTTTPYSKLALVDATTTLRDVFTISTSSTSGLIFKVDSYGVIYADGGATIAAADYAEYFRTNSVGLKSGEIVCVDILENNTVKRCERGGDNNVMGIVSTKPAVIGNYIKEALTDPSHYVVVGMLGQVDAYVSAENGPINVGDSLTSASSTPGYARRADAGDSTVGVALEPLASGTGKIKVLISRRNKSLAVEEVEALVIERVANMKIEDQVQQMIKQAVDNLNLDPKITEIARDEAGKLDAALTVNLDDLNGSITNLRTQTLASINDLNNRINNFQSQLSTLASTTSLAENIKIDEAGNLVIGASPLSGGGSSVRIIDPMEITASSSQQAAFVVNQQGSGDIADFQNNGVSIMKIADSGQVKIMGSMLVDGRIMLCTGGNCSNTLDSAVDETSADLGVEGKVVAGAFEGYCADGYIWVPGSAKYGTLPGFCVMSDLAAGDGLNPPTPFVKGGINAVRVNVSQGEAQAACQGLGAGYHLIGENEWLTIAENILAVTANDVDAVMAGMQLGVAPFNKGGEGGFNEASSTATSTAYTLTNDNIINNLAGATAEWTNQNVTSAGLPVTALADSWSEYSAVSDYKGLNIAPDYYLSDANNYIGKIYVGSQPGLKGFVRGLNGIYGLDLSHTPSEQSESIGFRCAK